VDGGVLVKVGPKVMVSTPRAVRGELGRLQQTVRDSFTKLSDRERQARAAVERMELDFVRQLIEWQHGR